MIGTPPIVSNIEVIWENEEAARLLEALGSFCRFAHFDKRGQGMSDRVDEVPTLERRAADMLAVMDATGMERAVVSGVSEGGATAIMAAATYPERVTGLQLFGAFARMTRTAGYPAGYTDDEIDLGAKLWVDTWATPQTATVALITPDRVGDKQFVEFVNRFERQSSTPRGLEAQIRWGRDIDLRPVLPVIDKPTLIMHRRDDRLIPVEHGRWLAENIRGARFVELPGNEHVPYFGESDLLLAEIEEFVTGQRGQRPVDRVLATVLFTDIVASTERAAALGDRQWHVLLDRHDAMAKRIVDRHGGRVVKGTGDGLLATFDGPARAVRCGKELVHAANQIDLPLRAGAHTGEIELRGKDVAGIAVHIGARVASCADAGEMLVSRTVKDLVIGSGLGFEDLGEHHLKGIADPWQLFRVRDNN
jgi:class 3 adenylate cyclase/alpha-beta hydrolase superfamily lysophospholipase